MNTPRYALALLCALGTYFLSAQEQDLLDWHPYEGSRTEDARPSVVAVRADGSYLVHASSGSKTILRHYGPDHRLRLETSEKYRAGRDRFYPTAFLSTASQHYGLAFPYDRGTERTLLYSGDMIPGGFTNILRRFTLRGLTGESDSFDPDNASVYRDELRKLVSASPSGESILLVDAQLGENEAIEVAVFDSSFVHKWRQSVPIPAADTRFRLHSVSLTDEGTVFALGSDHTREATLERSGSSLHVYAVTADDVIDQHVVLDEGLCSLNARMTLTGRPDQPVVVSGLYTSDPGSPGVEGVFHIRFDARLRPLSQTLSEFKVPIGSEPAAGADPLMGYSLAVNHATILPDGSVWTFVEERRTFTQQNGKATQEMQETGDLFVYRYDAAGELLGRFTIPKHITSTSDQGYIYDFVKMDRVYLVFNEVLQDPPGKDKTVQSTLVELDFAGQVVERTPFHYFAPETGRIFSPADTWVVGNTLLLTVHQGNQVAFASLRLDAVPVSRK